LCSGVATEAGHSAERGVELVLLECFKPASIENLMAVVDEMQFTPDRRRRRELISCQHQRAQSRASQSRDCLLHTRCRRIGEPEQANERQAFRWPRRRLRRRHRDRENPQPVACHRFIERDQFVAAIGVEWQHRAVDRHRIRHFYDSPRCALDVDDETVADPVKRCRQFSGARERDQTDLRLPDDELRSIESQAAGNRENRAIDRIAAVSAVARDRLRLTCQDSHFESVACSGVGN
jgi:hypothetical protein